MAGPWYIIFSEKVILARCKTPSKAVIASYHCVRAAEMVDADFAVACDRIADTAAQAETRALADSLLEKMAELATAYRADLVD